MKIHSGIINLLAVFAAGVVCGKTQGAPHIAEPGDKVVETV